MADFKTPNLCGANESLNNASSKIEDLISELDAKVTSAASEAAAALNTKIADVKAGLDGLAKDLPETPAVNLQSEITSLINDVDRTTVEGIQTFNAKFAQLQQDFGGILEKKGLDLDELITEGTTKLGKDVQAASDFLTGTGSDSLTGELTQAFGLDGKTVNLSSGDGISGVAGKITEYTEEVSSTVAAGGNLCDLVPNLEIPADLSGTGVTTEEIEERASNAATLTLTQTPEEILEVTGKKTTQSFFTNIQHTVNGKVIVPKATGTYSEIKVLYTISKIAEKPIAAKQADVPAESEEVSIVTNNTGALSTKTTLADITTSYETPPGEEGSVYEKTEKSTPVVVPTGKTVKATTREDSISVLSNNAVRRETAEGGIITGSVQTDTTTVRDGVTSVTSKKEPATYSVNGFTYRVHKKVVTYLTSLLYNEESEKRKKKYILWDGGNTLPLPEKYPEPIQILFSAAEEFEEDEDGVLEYKTGGFYSDYNPDFRRLRVEYGTWDGISIGRAFGMETPDSLDNAELRITYRYYDKLNPLNKPK